MSSNRQGSILGAMIRIDETGQLTGVDIIATSDKETQLVLETLKRLINPAVWNSLGQLASGGLIE